MKRWILTAALIIAGAAAMLFNVSEAQEPAAAQIARVEGAQTPNRQGFDPYTIPEMMKRFHTPGVSIAVVRDFNLHFSQVVRERRITVPVTTAAAILSIEGEYCLARTPEPG